MKRIKYQEGDVFVFPLRSDGYGVGLITRISSDKHRIPLGYFFKHKYVLIPTMIDFDLIEKNKTILNKQVWHSRYKERHLAHYEQTS